jgi:hypothetical protein
MELEITWGRAIRVWWAYIWRYLVLLIVAEIPILIFGVILHFICDFIIGVPSETRYLIVFVLNLAIGLPLLVIPVKMMLGKNPCDFRLVLLSPAPQPSQST